MNAIAQTYVAGVFTRRVEGLIQTLGIRGLSESQVVAKGVDGMVDECRNRPLNSVPGGIRPPPTF